MNFTRQIRRILCIALATVIMLTAAPVHASAAPVGKTLRTNAKIGKTYTYKCYYPGIGYVDMNATFKSVKDTQSSYPGYRQKTGVIRITMPKSTKNKIINNVDKVVKGANSRDFYYCEGMVLDYNTGRAVTMNNSKSQFEMTPVYKSMKRYYKGNYSHNVSLKCDYHFSCLYPESMKGKLLMGVAGSTTPIYSLNNKLYNFYTGQSSITKTTFYSKKNKELSIFYRF